LHIADVTLSGPAFANTIIACGGFTMPFSALQTILNIYVAKELHIRPD